MNWQLTEGAIDTLLTGGSVSCPVLQILGCKKILGEDRYRLLVSDGHHISSSVILSEKFNDKLISGELSNYCVVRVDDCVVEEEEEKNLLSILELTILAKGQEVNRKIGKLVSFTEGKCDPAEVKRNWRLTEGAMATIMTGGSVLWPVLQILGSKRIDCGPRERYRLLVSDGRNLNSITMLATELNNKMTSGELSDFSVFRVDRWTVSMRHMEGRRNRRVLIILELTILARGQEVRRKIGQPVHLPDTESDPPAEAPPAVAPLPAGNPDWQLSQGAMATIMTGGSVSCPIFQILGNKRIMGNGPSERYRLLVSDGCHLNSFVMLSTQLNDMLTSGELSDFAVVRVDHWIVSKLQQEGRTHNRMVMIILKLTSLARGHEVGRKIGQPVALPEAESHPPAEAPPAVAPVPAALNQHPAADPDWQLTQGAMATILTGGSVSSPIFQLLGSKRISGGPSERYRLLVSDGRHLNSFAMLATQLNDMVTSGELSDFSVFGVQRWITSQVQAQGQRNRRVLIILELTIFASGQEVGRKIGQPVPLPENVTDPPAEAQPAVAPVNIDWHAAERHRLSRLHATFACSFLRRAIALSPERLRGLLNRAAMWRSFPAHELFRTVAELPPVQVHAAVRRMIAIFSRQAAHRRPAAA